MKEAAFALGWIFLLATGAGAASFDCGLPHLAPDERAICDNRDLNDDDVRMVTRLDFLTGLFAMGTRGAILDDQREWLRNRQSCGADLPCLRRSYRERLDALQAIYDGIDRPL